MNTRGLTHFYGIPSVLQLLTEVSLDVSGDACRAAHLSKRGFCMLVEKDDSVSPETSRLHSYFYQ